MSWSSFINQPNGNNYTSEGRNLSYISSNDKEKPALGNTKSSITSEDLQKRKEAQRKQADEVRERIDFSNYGKFSNYGGKKTNRRRKSRRTRKSKYSKKSRRAMK